ncbi:MAG: MBL fold metallo-hydrolase [Kiritimatiellae bacterium]|nr:MBL fold metallo-hydrolase [Kiritimatiellia bacterium]
MIQWSFIGGTSEVTGSRHLLDTGEAKLLFDCGLYQGTRKEADEFNASLGFDPADVDEMVLSHAHIDHCGNIPSMTRKGWRGPIHMTKATGDLVPIMLRDSARIQEADAAYLNQKTSRRGLPQVQPLYTTKDAEAAIPLIQTHHYYQPVPLAGGVELIHVDAGHVLGAGLASLDIPRSGGRPPLRVALAFDLGRYNLPLLNDPVQIEDPDILIVESTYGNRLHAPAANARADLRDAILPPLERGGKALIPCFAFERTQEILFHLAALRDAGELPRVPVYVDSPMAAAITQVFEHNHAYLDPDTRDLQEKHGQVITRDWITFTESIDESKAITASGHPAIVLAASGMCENGRIRHHLKHGIENPRNRIILVGYQAINTLGRRLQNDEKQVYIFGDLFQVKAEVMSLHAFSAHADKLELFRYIRKAHAKHIFLVHGEQESREALAQMLKTNLHSDHVYLPNNGDVVDFEALVS